MACTLDFRRLDEGLGGQKNKRKRRSPSPTPMDCEGEDDNSTYQSSKRAALPSLADPNKPSFGKPTYDGVIAGRVSGRKWKQPRTQRASAALVMRIGKSWEEREREKQIKKAYRERKEELKEEIRKNKQEKREKREEREKKKKENILRTGTKFQKISNPKTLQKIAKSKQKKLLKVVPDEVFDRSKRKTEKKNVEDGELAFHVQCSERSCKGCSCEAREHVVLKAKELQSGLDSQFPSFIKLMEQLHVSGVFWLEFPTPFCEKYLPRENTKMTLIDENLDTFKTLFLPHRSGLTLGWQEFCISHKLVQGDVLIFHLANPTTFKVYVLKAGGFPCASLSNSEIGSKKIISRPTTTREAQLRRSTRLSAKTSTQCTSEKNESLDAAVDAEYFSENKDQEGEAVVAAKESNLPPTDKRSLRFELKREIKCKESAVEEHCPLCKICMEDAICMLLLPCKHLVLCKTCEPKLSICPICNTGKVSSVEVFLS